MRSTPSMGAWSALVVGLALIQPGPPLRQDIDITLNRMPEPAPPADTERPGIGLAPPLRQDVDIALNRPPEAPPLADTERTGAGLAPRLRQDVDITLNRPPEAP